MSNEEGCDISVNQSEGCPVPVGNSICGEANSLEIMKEFNKLYEERMQQIDSEAGGDCLQEKVKLQQEWIRNLTQQNEMLVRAVQELEYEATERVQQLEEKLHKSAQCLCEVMKKYREHDFTVDLLAEPLQKISHLEDDIRNLLEFVRRARENEQWSIDGLFFYNIAKEDLLGIKCKYANKLTTDYSNESEKRLQENERTVHELTQRVNHFNSFGDVEGMAKELTIRREECESLKQAMIDMRQALTEEVALKHDEVIMLRKDYKMLEDRCLQADKQTSFKEDIIKELRKEIKQLKQQDQKEDFSIHFPNLLIQEKDESLGTNSEVAQLKKYITIKDNLLEEQLNLIKTLVTKLFTIDIHLKDLEERTVSVTSLIADREMDTWKERMRSLETENVSLKETLTIEKTHIEELDEQFKSFLRDRDILKRKNKELEKRVKTLGKEMEVSKCECVKLQSKIQQLKAENEKLQYETKAGQEELTVLKDESIVHQRKLRGMAEENRKTLEQILSLNEENRSLSQNIDALRQRSECICTQEEISRLNDTIEKLQTNLDRTAITHGEEETARQKEILELNETINVLEHDLNSFQEKYQRDCKICKICRGKAKVGFLETSAVQADLESKESELLKGLNDMKTKMSVEIEKRNNTIQMLKNKVNELESSLNNCEERAANLQEAVTLYSNSVNVLETAKEEAKKQIEQQKITITNLQEAVVEAKQEVDELRRKTQENDIKRQGILSILENVLQDTEEENEFIRKHSIILNQEHEKLQDLNFTLEVEHCDSLQDVDVLEDQVHKYKGLFKENETQMKKLSKQKRCYEEIISYFKHEMGLMADQLNNLQEMLSLSNETTHQESSRIMHAFLEVQAVNEKLSSQLCACEQRNQLDNQMNQLHEAKICELQCLVKEKEMDLTKHDQAILNIRKTLNESVKQNGALQETIMELNETINQLRGSINDYELENCESKKSCLQFQEQISGYCSKLQELKRNLEDKTATSLKLEMAYNNEKRALKAAQKLLQETEKLQQEKQQNLINELEDLKHKFAVSDGNNSKLCQECETLQNQLATLSRKEAVKDLEIKRYRKIVGDLKSTMMELNSELNKNLAQKELGGCCKSSSFRQATEQDGNCPCDVECHQNMVDALKKAVINLKRKLIETQERNKHLEDEIIQKDEQLSEAKKEKDELNQKLLESQFNEKRISELEREVDQLREELQVKSLQLNDVKRSAQEINGSKCVQLAFAQEEINNLKGEMTNILNRQCGLKRENDELQSETVQLHCQVTCLGEKNKMFKEQIDQQQTKIRSLTTERDKLIHKNKEILAELKALPCMATSYAHKQPRITNDSLKQLEADIEDLKNNKEEICLESKNVIKNVRAWVTEQKRINSLVAKREQEFMETIKKFSYDKEISTSQQQALTKATPTCKANRCRNTSASPCSLGSQGNASYYDGESPPSSPDYGVNEWYSSTFRSESDNDSEEDYCVSTLENLTQQMKKSNKVWMDEKNTHRDCRACKGCKETK